MSYLDYINQFHRVRRHHPKWLSSNAADLYFYLLSVANNLGWKKNPFNEGAAIIEAMLHMTDKTLSAARELLIEAGLIAYTPGKKGTASAYELLVVEENATENFRSISGRNRGESGGESGGLHKSKIKEEESKANATTYPSSFSVEGNQQPKPTARPKKAAAHADEVAALDLPHPGPAFAELWTEFRAMPKQVKKPVSALRRLLATLGKYAEGFACQLLDKAIQGAWSGVEFDGTPEAYAKWQAVEADRLRRQSTRPNAHVADGPALNHEFIAQQQAREQAEQDEFLADWEARHNPPDVGQEPPADPDAPTPPS